MMESGYRSDTGLNPWIVSWIHRGWRSPRAGWSGGPGWLRLDLGTFYGLWSMFCILYSYDWIWGSETQPIYMDRYSHTHTYTYIYCRFYLHVFCNVSVINFYTKCVKYQSKIYLAYASVNEFWFLGIWLNVINSIFLSNNLTCINWRSKIGFHTW